MKISYLPYTLQLKHQFKLSHNSRKVTPIVIIKIEKDGYTGFGEASLPPYLNETQESVIEFIKKTATINFDDALDIFSFYEKIEKIDEGNTAAKAALDIAFHDLLGNMNSKPVHSFYSNDVSELPLTSMTIGIDDEQILKQKIEEAADFKILKIKLGTEGDKKIITSIRKFTDKPLYVDANQGWEKKEIALEMIDWLADKNILLIEQPLKKNCLDDMNWLKEKSQLPIIADESVQRLIDIEKLKDCFDGINIKLMKCTGIYEAHKMILKAHELNLKVMLGCMTESSCGISAAIQLVSFVDYADLDGNCLIVNDPFYAKTVEDGKLVYSNKPGLGVTPMVNLNFIPV